MFHWLHLTNLLGECVFQSKLLLGLLTNWVKILLLNDHSILEQIINHWHQSSFQVLRASVFLNIWVYLRIKQHPRKGLLAEISCKIHAQFDRRLCQRIYPSYLLSHNNFERLLLVTFMSTQSSATQWLPLTTSSPGPLPFFLGKSPRDEVVPVKVFRSWGLVENLASPVRLEFAYFIL